MRDHTVYSKILVKFHEWCTARDVVLVTPCDVDKGATRFSRRLGKGQNEQFLAALLKAYPPLRGRLPWLAAAVKLRQLRNPPQHHPPMTWEVALGVATGLRLLGYHRDATLLLVQWRLGLRPSEALRLAAEDISLPNAAGRVAVVRLGTRYGTKLRRVQFARAYPGDVATMYLLSRVVACRRPEETLGNSLTTPQLTARIRRSCARVGMPQIWTAHCPRAGWTTARHLAGQPFSELREDGRWTSDRSLRIYIDAVTAVDVDRIQALVDLSPWLAELGGRFYSDYFWV